MAKFNSENNLKSDTITGTVMTIAYFYWPVWQFSFINHGECYWMLFTGLSGRQPDSLGRHLHFMDILYLISNYFITYLLYLAGWNTHDIHSGNFNNTLAGKKKTYIIFSHIWFLFSSGLTHTCRSNYILLN